MSPFRTAAARGLAAALFMVVLSACDLVVGVCGSSRSLFARGDLTGAQVVPSVATPDSGRVELFLSDDSEDQDHVDWELRTSVPPSRFTAVHIHEGRSGETGRILQTLPAHLYQRPPSPYSLGGRVEHASPPSMNELFALLRQGGAYVDIHTVDRADGVLRAQLTTYLFQDWNDYVCD
jgi:hypothetical protein